MEATSNTLFAKKKATKSNRKTSEIKNPVGGIHMSRLTLDNL